MPEMMPEYNLVAKDHMMFKWATTGQICLVNN